MEFINRFINFSITFKGYILQISSLYKEFGINYIYHFTPIENYTEMIRNNSELLPRALHASHGVEPLKYLTDETSRDIDTKRGFDNYIFYVFGDRHPLIFKKQKTGLVLKPLFASIEIIDRPGVKISDRVATDNSATFYTPEEALDKLYIAYCGKTYIEDSTIWDQVRKYEILVPYVGM